MRRKMILIMLLGVALALCWTGLAKRNDVTESRAKAREIIASLQEPTLSEDEELLARLAESLHGQRGSRQATIGVMDREAVRLHNRGSYYGALALLDEVLSHRLEYLGPRHPATLATESRLVDVHWHLGDFQEARKISEELLPISRQVLGEEHRATLDAWETLAGVLQAQGHSDRARQIEAKVLEIRRRVLGESHPDTLRAKAGLAIILKAQGECLRPRAMEEEVLQTAYSTLGPEHPVTLRAMINLANTMTLDGELRQAFALKAEVFVTRRRLFGPQHPATLSAQCNLARTLFAMNDLEGARRLLEELLEIRRSVVGPDLEPQMFGVFYTLGRIYRELGQTDQAVDSFLRALDAVEAQTVRSGDSEDFRSAFKARYEPSYRAAVTALLVLGRTAQAHYVLERFRAQSFLRMLAERDVVFAEIPPELEEQLRRVAKLYDDVFSQRERLRGQEHLERHRALNERLRQLRRERERVNAEIRRRAGGAAEIQYPQPVTIAGVRKSLEPGTLMLSYFVGPEETVLFTLSHLGELEVHRLDTGEAELDEQIERFFDQLQGTVATELEAGRLNMGRWLYEKLLEPADRRIEHSERLLIIPDGPLHRLPFAALIRPAEATEPGWQYLIEWKPLHSALSATVYARLRDEPPESRSDIQWQAVAFGNPSYSEADSHNRTAASKASDGVLRSAFDRGIIDDLEPLPYTEREVKTIERLFPSTRTFLGRAATEENAKTIGKDARIVHFAAHAVADPDVPLDSFVALSIVENQEENGLLQAWEIFERIRLDADLVVLSACQTAYGPETDGEGLMSLSRAFQYAGARTVMASLWGVHDASTAELMIRFYQHLHAGKTKDEALRAAQLEFLRGPVEVEENGVRVEKDYSSPSHWAAFQVIGDWN